MVTLLAIEEDVCLVYGNTARINHHNLCDYHYKKAYSECEHSFDPHYCVKCGLKNETVN